MVNFGHLQVAKLSFTIISSVTTLPPIVTLDNLFLKPLPCKYKNDARVSADGVLAYDIPTLGNTSIKDGKEYSPPGA